MHTTGRTTVLTTLPVVPEPGFAAPMGDAILVSDEILVRKLHAGSVVWSFCYYGCPDPPAAP